MEIIKQSNGVIKVDCAPYELAQEINDGLIRYLFRVEMGNKAKYEEIREPCLKVIAVINELLNSIPNEIKEQLPEGIGIIRDEDRLLHFLGLK